MHTVKFDDGDEEEYDLLQPEKERPAWETEPFTNQGTECGDRFGLDDEVRCSAKYQRETCLYTYIYVPLSWAPPRDLLVSLVYSSTPPVNCCQLLLKYLVTISSIICN